MSENSYIGDFGDLQAENKALNSDLLIGNIKPLTDLFGITYQKVLLTCEGMLIKHQSLRKIYQISITADENINLNYRGELKGFMNNLLALVMQEKNIEKKNKEEMSIFLDKLLKESGLSMDNAYQILTMMTKFNLK